jgi:hypothetical protein
MLVPAFASSCAAFTIGLSLVTTSDALDLFKQHSPWALLSSTTSPRDDGRPSETTQVFLRCAECTDLATSLTKGEGFLSVPLPSYNGAITRFALRRTTDATMSGELQAQFPDAQTYFGRNDEGVTVEVDATLAGGVRVQYHGKNGELSYLDRVRSDDVDLSLISEQVRAAVASESPVFRVYQHVAGQRASDPLSLFAHTTTCSTAPQSSTRDSDDVGADSARRRLQEGDCGLPNYVKDGYCDPLNNNAGCSWDSGDCCGRDVDKKYCTASAGGGPDSEGCSCLDPNFSDQPDPDTKCIASYIGDGYCDANNNNAACQHDHSDCCGVFADRSTCTGENCACPAEADFNNFGGHTYRIAVGTSKGYSNFHGNSVASVLSEVLTAVNRVGGSRGMSSFLPTKCRPDYSGFTRYDYSCLSKFPELRRKRWVPVRNMTKIQKIFFS